MTSIEFTSVRGIFIVAGKTDESLLIFDKLGKVSVVRSRYEIGLVSRWVRIEVLVGVQCCICDCFPRPPYPNTFWTATVNKIHYQVCDACEVWTEKLRGWVNRYAIYPKSVKMFRGYDPSVADQNLLRLEKCELMAKIFLTGQFGVNQIPPELRQLWLKIFLELMCNPWIFMSLEKTKEEKINLKHFLKSRENFRK